jgi:hypothetical protein
MRFRNQPVEIGEAAEDSSYIAIIGNVISKIRHWRRIDGRNPNDIDSERYKMVQALNDSRKVANSISITILK